MSVISVRRSSSERPPLLGLSTSLVRTWRRGRKRALQRSALADADHMAGAEGKGDDVAGAKHRALAFDLDPASTLGDDVERHDVRLPPALLRE